MTLAIFDLDNTLIAGDSDHLWGEFLIDQGIVDADGFKAANDGFFQDYQDGRLDIFAYQEFVLGVLKGRPLEELDRLRQRYMDTVIDSIWLPAAEQLIADHRESGHTLMIITATQAATNADGLYTGRVQGIPSYQYGKVERLSEWLVEHQETLDGSYFYSDSHNDLPLLRKVDHPVAVDPDPTLERHARELGWPILSLRAPS